MLVAAFVFGLIILSISLFFLIFYVRSHRAMREKRNALARHRERHLKVQLDLQARMDMEARQFEEARLALFKQAGMTTRTDRT